MSPDAGAGTTLAFSIHGVRLSVATDADAIATALARRLEAFAIDAVEADDNVLRVKITGPHAAPTLDPSLVASARVVYEGPAGVIRYIDDLDRVVADYDGRVELDVRASAGTAHIAVVGDAPEDLMLSAYPLFSITLMELMKRRGRYALHAAAVARAGAGLLLAGTSGAGKSTLAAACTRAGFDFLSDDTVFLDVERRHVLAFPDELDLTDDSIAMFAELEPAQLREPMPGRPKRSVPAREVFGGNTALECRATALVLPHVAHADTSRLAPIDADVALRELLPNVLLTHAPTSQAHLDALGRLAREVPAYRLDAGRDLDEIVELLTPLIAAPQPRSTSHTEPT